MASSKFSSARAYGKRYRYEGDIPTTAPEHPDSYSTKMIKKMLSTNGLHIDPSLTPTLYECLEKACTNLKVPVNQVFAYVLASSELQAICFESDAEHCVVQISSALINLLNFDEITFVLGHEIGHHVLGHLQDPNRASNESLESLMAQRAQEISVDRAGLLACQSLEDSLKAIMKMISGLPEQYIRFDASKFINQLRLTGDDQTSLADAASTHPSLILRARALLWFSMNQELPLEDMNGSLPMNKVNELVKKDLDRFIDNAVKDQIKKCEDDLLFWLCAKHVTLKGKFSRADRLRLIDEFGDENISKLVGILDGMSLSEVANFINSKIDQAKEDLTKAIPIRAQEQIEQIHQEANQKFPPP